MIISQIGGGIGNQLFMYAAGRRLAHKLNVEFKLGRNPNEDLGHSRYVLNLLNIKADTATPQDIDKLKSNPVGIEKDAFIGEFMPEVLDYPDNVYLRGCWENERYFADIADILRKELTLKNPLGATAQHWKEKILAAECSLSLHFRHGDFINNPTNNSKDIFVVLPLDYYYHCLDILKRCNTPPPTLFIFSNNLQWCKENIRVDLPIEFVEGEGLQDVEELYLMSLCKHNIIANSTFSWWGAWLNQNPDKKVFVPIPESIVGTGKTYRHFSAERNENSPLDSDKWIRVPFDPKAQPAVTMRPLFSILLVVNNDIDTLVESLNSILGNDYRYFELIIIDNASTDDSGKICQQAAKTHDNVKLIKLYQKVQNGMAWNMALNVAQGDFVLFLKGSDRILFNVMGTLCLQNTYIFADVMNSVVWLKESIDGNIELTDKKFVMEKISAFQNFQGIFREKLNKQTLLRVFADNETFPPLGTRIFKRKFLLEHEIKFKEKIGDDAETLFTLDAIFQTDEIIFTSNIFYVAPSDKA